MKRINFVDIVNQDSKLVTRGTGSTIIEISNGEILKVFDLPFLKFISANGINLERKVLDSERVVLHQDILKPTSIVYYNSTFVGYIMEKACGISLNDYDSRLSMNERKDLFNYAEIYKKIEDIVKFSDNVVFPDLCTIDNIFIDSFKKIKFIDYDGLQFLNHEPLCISTTLGDQNQYDTPKYRSGNYFTKELDKKSLIMFYFLFTLNINLNKVERIMSFDELFYQIGLKDYDLMNKVWNVFYGKGENEYLGDDVFKIAQDYNMIVCKVGNAYLKKLVRK